MKKIGDFLSKHKGVSYLMIGGVFIFSFFYIYYIKFLLPIPFMGYENYHGIEYLNNVYVFMTCGAPCYNIYTVQDGA